MGLRETFQKVAQTAMAAAGNVPVKVTYISISDDPGYNPSVGDVTEYEIPYIVNMMFDLNLSEDIRNIAINQNEKLGYIAVNDLKPEPKIDDRITINYVDWTIVEIFTDPADALWIIKIKKQ